MESRSNGVTFDKKAPTFRHEEYEEYKANRKKMPEELVPQIPMLQQTLAKTRNPNYCSRRL